MPGAAWCNRLAGLYIATYTHDAALATFSLNPCRLRAESPFLNLE